MNKNIVFSAALFFTIILSLGTISAVELKIRNNNEISTRFKTPVQPTFYDMVRCTCNGEACSSAFESQPNVSAGSLIAYCARACSCRTKVGFTYETEY